MASINLPEVDHAQVTILVDNYTDLLLPDSPGIKRLRTMPPDVPMAEHGLACLITVQWGDKRHTILMDAGISGHCLNHNAALLPSSLAAVSGEVTHTIEDVEAIVLSHGHFDHFAGLPVFISKTGKKLPMIVHPDAFVERRIHLAPGTYAPMPVLDEEALVAAGALLEKRDEPSTVAGGAILISGTVARTSEFETGSPGLQAKRNGGWIEDPFTDDQAVAFLLKGHGLVVLGGCSHSGIVNTVAHMRQVSGVDRVHAVMGGFHLSGPSEKLIEPTVAAMKEVDPELIVPTHCTGWKATEAFARAMPEPFILNTVGTTYLFT